MPNTPAPSLSLTIRRHYAAPKAEVFRAWTDPQTLMRWWGPPGHEAPSIDVDLKPGGRYRFAMRKLPDGKPFYANGMYEEVAVPDRLVFTWNWEAGGPPYGSNTLVTIELFDAPGGGTDLVLTHDRFEDERARSEHTKGWAGGLEKLSEIINGTY